MEDGGRSVRTRRHAWLGGSLLGLGFVFLLAGCLSVEDGFQDGSPGPWLGVESELASHPGERGLEVAPSFALGEWWTVEAFWWDKEETVTLAVAGEDADSFLVGYPAGKAYDMPFIHHYPGIGEIRKHDLAYLAHDRWMKFLDFPLTDGKAWDASYYLGEPMTIQVEHVAGNEAHLVAEIENRGTASYTYNASLGAVTSYELVRDGTAWVGFDVVDHGLGYEGDLVVPYGIEQAFCRFIGQAGLYQTQGRDCEATDPGPMSGIVPIDGDATNAVFLMDAVAGYTVAPGAGAYAHLQVETPAGNTFEVEAMAGDDAHAYHHVPEGAGAWSYEATVGPNSVVLLEGAVYQALEATLPPAS